MRSGKFWCLIGLVILSASAAFPAREAGYRSVLIRNVPHMEQKSDFCGEACAAMYLQHLGLEVDQDFVFDQSGLDPLEARGCYTRELTNALKTIGFQIGKVWYEIQAGNSAKELEQQFALLHQDLTRGIPSIVCMHYHDHPQTTEHFRLILGYDSRNDDVYFHEPAKKDGAYQKMQRAEFMKLWPLKYRQERWTIIRMPLVKGELVRGKTASNFTAADYAQHMMQLKEKLKKVPDSKFHILVQEPFIVLGDEPEATVKRRSAQTIKWAIEKLKQDYFNSDPKEIIDIWLFKDKESYEKHAKLFFGSKPTTPFGYYTSRHQALVMNISTGGGTLVHEIVHPFMAANFTKCPSWFNEGLASLYEQCGEKDGHIHGYTNWRLRGLQQAIRGEKVPSFEILCKTTTTQFYNEDPGTHYSQARYLCYYLQERGLLVKFYHQFRKDARTDSTGLTTLKTILGNEGRDLAAFKKSWETYVMALR